MTGRKRRCIALLIDQLESEYPAEIVAGVSRAARQAQARTLVVPGGWLPAVGGEPVLRNFIYDLLLETRIDGVLIAAGSLSNYCGLGQLRGWIRRFQQRPCVALGLDLETLPSVYVDNESGMYEAVSHLIERHGRQHIAFIGGPQQSQEACARFNAYRRALADHGIPFDERFVRHGALARENGVAAMMELLDERRVALSSIESVVGVNDAVTLGAIEELNRRGLAVPERVAAVGFDDSNGARSSNPPLTSVNQAVESQAYTAACALFEAIANGRPAVGSRLESKAVFRTSCGCAPGFQNDSANVKPAPVRLARTCRMALVERRDSILREVARAACGRLTGASRAEAQLVDALLEELVNELRGSFVRGLASVLRRHFALSRDVMICHEVISVLRLEALACAGLEPELRPRVEDLFQESRLALARIGGETERERLAANNLRFRSLSKACLSLFGDGRHEALARLLGETLPPMGIDAYAVGRLQRYGEAGALELWAQRSPEGRAPALGALVHHFDALLDGVDTVVMEPLDFDGAPVGVAALAWGALEMSYYEQLREVLSAATFASGRASR